jgi:CubicO group peptidase (beta-lactamase class C family)
MKSFRQSLPARLLFCALLCQSLVWAQSPSHNHLDEQTRAALIEGALQALNTSYVFPEKAKEMEAAIRARQARKEYDGLTSGEAFAQQLTAHLQEVSRDKHLRVVFTSGGAGLITRLDPSVNRVLSIKRNFGFEKIERLAGNVGYLDLRGFEDERAAGETAAAAMTFLANTDALIIDLRNNGGGSPGMVALLSSYLFDQPTHLNSIYDRPSNTTREFWTQASVPGKRYGNDKPVYVLTSKRTFSAAEEFTYNLKQLKRATVVGETTGGGAHPVNPRRINAQFIITVPSGRAINPITKTNWEGTGVAPDLAVTAEQALKAAHLAALQAITPKLTEPQLVSQLQNAIARLQSELAPKLAPLAAPPATKMERITTEPLAQANVKLPDTPAGRSFGKFLAALNSGALETMKRFHRENGGDEENAQQDFEIYQRTGGLNLHSVTTTSDYELTALVQSRKDSRWLNFSIVASRSAPHGITDIRVSPTTPPNGAAPANTPKPTAEPAKKKSEAEALKEVERLLERQSGADEFSGVVLIAKGGQPIFQRAYRLASREYNVPNRMDTKFNLGSINKFFTQIAILQLLEQGKLALSDTIGKHLPNYPNKQAAEKATIEHLLKMRSGIGDFFGKKYEETPKNRLRTINDYLKLFADAPLAFEPGTSSNYSNGGYIVLGALIEQLTGQSYYDYVREHIYKPAGMLNTDAYEEDMPVPNLATGYTRRSGRGGNERVSNVYSKPARGSSAGGGYSTAEDLLKFTQALRESKLLSPARSKQLLGNLGVAGGAPGINAVLEDTGTYTFIVLSNYDPPSAESISEQIRRLF